MNMPFRPIATALLLAVAACRGTPAGPPPLAGAALGGPFALIDQNGKAVTERDFAGRARAVYFGYTFCPDVCPTTLQVLMAGYRRFAADHPQTAHRLVPIFITVDPRRDTPAVLRTYVAAFGPGLIGLTGSDEAIARTAKAYGSYAKLQPAARGASDYLVDHSSQVILFGPAGEPIALVPTDRGPDAVAATFAQWVR